jgi:DNA-binding transcriptional regulator YiaG
MDIPSRRDDRVISAEAIRTWRTQHGLTQTDLSYMLGLSPIVVSHWETGRTKPQPYLHLALAELSRQLTRRKLVVS